MNDEGNVGKDKEILGRNGERAIRVVEELAKGE